MRIFIATIVLLLAPTFAPAQARIGADGGKLLLTAGFNDIEGAGGGGLVPWALITGYGSDRSWGANAHYTDVRLRDFDLRTAGIAVGVLDRLEVSATRHELDVTGTAIEGLQVSQDIFGIKARLAGDAVYAQDSWLPQLAVGAQLKRNGGIENGGSLTSVTQLGARDEKGVDVYLSGTKVFLAQSLLVNLTVRYSSANQLGLLGFGGDDDDAGSVNAEATVGYLITRKLAVGGEYRGKPDNLAADDEGAAWDVFLAYAPNRHISIVAAYLNMGNILGPATTVNHDQNGAYVSVQVGF
jgi:hypothetical protein